MSPPNSVLAATEVPRAIALPLPQQTGGESLMDVLRLRHSTREYSARELSMQTLSDVLWAAFGINRPNGDRTAPYWRHIMVMDIYVSKANGVWLYDPKVNALLSHMPDDIRAQTGMQDFVGIAPVNLIYVAHGDRMIDISVEDRRLYASVDTAFMGQNVYLYCASEGLATVFRGAVDCAKLGSVLKLPEGQFVTFAQTVGYPRIEQLKT